MTPEQFCYWLQGMLESGRDKFLDSEQTEMIRKHLQTVFKKVTDEIPQAPLFSGIAPGTGWPYRNGDILC